MNKHQLQLLSDMWCYGGSIVSACHHMCVLLYATGVDISEGALVAAASLSARYINGRFLPDKVGWVPQMQCWLASLHVKEIIGRPVGEGMDTHRSAHASVAHAHGLVLASSSVNRFLLNAPL